ncbi:MAG: peptide chain release factor N(5)-glutamine methyltransferase, partial [Opitutaceae bacterium]
FAAGGAARRAGRRPLSAEPMDSKPDPRAAEPPMLTVLAVLRKTAEFFGARGIPNPRLDAELLVGHALGLPRMQLYLQFERLLAEPELARIRALVRRRASREPLQYVVGEVEFHGLKLKVDRRALIPRPETERLVELVIERAGLPPATALDLGTGTGAIALALAKAWPEAEITGVDSSSDALALAAENAAASGLSGRVSFLRSSWFSALPEGATYPWIVANPPYLSEGEAARAMPEVSGHEPAAALVAGEDGLAALREILEGAPPRLAPGGWLALESGPDQHEALRELARRAGCSRVESVRDLAGRDRYFFASA